MAFRKSRINILLGGALLVMAMGLTAGTAEAKAKPYIACETYSLRDYISQGKYDYITVMPVLKGLGMKGVTINEIWMKSYDKPYLDQIKKAAKDNGLKISGFIIEGNLAQDDAAARKKQIEDDAMKMKAAAYLGAPIVRLNLGGTGNPDENGTVGVQRAIEAFKELLPLAKQLKVKMTIENHGGVSLKADWILAIIKGTDPKWVGSCLDFMNWPLQDVYTETAKLAPYAFHTHAKCRGFKPDGEEASIEYSKMVQYLKDVHYKGAISIEYEGPGDQIEGVKKTRDLIQKYWKL